MRRGTMLPVFGLLIIVAACSERAPLATVSEERQRLDPASMPDRRLREAIETAEAAVADPAASAADWGHLGHLYLAHDFEQAALGAYRVARQKDSETPNWHYFVGLALSVLDPERAAEAFEAAAARDPKSIAAWLRAGYARKDSAQPERARDRFMTALALDSQLPAAELGLGLIALREGSAASAREHLERALELQPLLDQAHVALAQACMALGDSAGAARHRDAAGRVTSQRTWPDPLFEEIRNARVSTYWVLQRAHEHLNAARFASALSEFDKLATPGQADASIWSDRGAALLGLGRNADAEHSLQRALAVMAEDPGETPVPPDSRAALHVNLGIARTRQGRPDAAEANFRQALAAAPGSGMAARHLALLLAEQGRPAEALEVLETVAASERSPELNRLLFTLSLRDK